MYIFFVLELQDSDSKNLLIKIRSETLDETLEKLRSVFMSKTETSYLQCLDDPEILALIDPNLKPPTKELLDNVRFFLVKLTKVKLISIVYYLYTI